MNLAYQGNYPIIYHSFPYNTLNESILQLASWTILTVWTHAAKLDNTKKNK
jgi:hypothetical protein